MQPLALHVQRCVHSKGNTILSMALKQTRGVNCSREALQHMHTLAFRMTCLIKLVIASVSRLFTSEVCCGSNSC
jgi:hypothetical protein